MIYLDNAATTGVKPPEVIRATSRALSEYSANPGRSGHKVSEKTAIAVYNTRQKIADFFHASGAENVAFTSNCTHSINCVLKGVVGTGDHVIVSSLEHNAVMRPLAKMGVDYDTAQVSLTDDNVTLNEFRSKIKPNTRLIMCMGASNVLGKILPLSEIGKLCRERNILFAVDAAQTAGVLDINMADQGIDYLCIAPHKGLYAPMGIGILIAEKPIKNTIIEGGTGTDSININQPDTLPEQLESGTINVPAIIGTGAGLDFVSKTGVSKIHNHEMALLKMLYEGLYNNPEIILYTPHPQQYGYAPVLSFNMRGAASGEVAGILDRHGIAVRAGLHCAPTAHRQIKTLETGTVRVCPGVFNNQNEIAYLNRVLKSVKKV